jgi:hypothetical protein
MSGNQFQSALTVTNAEIISPSSLAASLATNPVLVDAVVAAIEANADPTFIDITLSNLGTLPLSTFLEGVSADSTLALSTALLALPSNGGTLTGPLYHQQFNSPPNLICLSNGGLELPLMLSDTLSIGITGGIGTLSLNASGNGTLVTTTHNGDPMTPNAPVVWDSAGNTKTGSPVLSGTLAVAANTVLAANSTTQLGTLTIGAAGAGMVAIASPIASLGNGVGALSARANNGGVIFVDVDNPTSAAITLSANTVNVRVIP